MFRLGSEKSDHEGGRVLPSQRDWDTLHEKVRVRDTFPEKDRMALMEALVDPCVHFINNARRSLGIVRPEILRYWLEEVNDVIPKQLPIWASTFLTRGDYPYVPRVLYRCSKCEAVNPHDQQILEWGFYEWQRKNPDKLNKVWENAKFESPEYAKFFLVGNQARYRTSFIVISAIRLLERAVTMPLAPLVKVTWRNREVQDEAAVPGIQLPLTNFDA